MQSKIRWKRQRGERGDRRGRLSNTKSLSAHTLYARVGIFIALPIVCSASFSRFSKIRQHLAGTRQRYVELFKRPGPISINAVRTILDLSSLQLPILFAPLCEEKSLLRDKLSNLVRSDLLSAMIHREQRWVWVCSRTAIRESELTTWSRKNVGRHCKRSKPRISFRISSWVRVSDFIPTDSFGDFVCEFRTRNVAEVMYLFPNYYCMLDC